MTDTGRRTIDDGGQVADGATRSPIAVVHSRKSDIAVAAACGVFVAFMVGMSYAAVPLYTWFCKSTGFGGTPQVVVAASGEVSDRRVTVRFDANLGAGLPWRFEPERNTIDVRLGEVVTIYYTVTNLSAQETAGQAVYNVTPTTVGAYFDKINCFCFTEQRLAGARSGTWRSSSMSIRRSLRIRKTTISTPLRSPTPSTRCARPAPALRLAQKVRA